MFKIRGTEELVYAAKSFVRKRSCQTHSLVRSCNDQLALWLQIEVRVCVVPVQDDFSVRALSNIIGSVFLPSSFVFVELSKSYTLITQRLHVLSSRSSLCGFHYDCLGILII